MQSGREQEVYRHAFLLPRSRDESSPQALEASSQACPLNVELYRHPLNAFSCLPRWRWRRASAFVGQTFSFV